MLVGVTVAGGVAALVHGQGSAGVGVGGLQENLCLKKGMVGAALALASLSVPSVAPRRMRMWTGADKIRRKRKSMVRYVFSAL